MYYIHLKLAVTLFREPKFSQNLLSYQFTFLMNVQDKCIGCSIIHFLLRNNQL